MPESDLIAQLRSELAGELKDIREKLTSLLERFAAMAEANKQVDRLQADVTTLRVQVDDLRQFRWQLAGGLTVLSLLAGLGGHFVGKALETPSPEHIEVSATHR